MRRPRDIARNEYRALFEVRLHAVRVLEQQVTPYVRDAVVQNQAVDVLLAEDPLGGLTRGGHLDEIAVAHEQRRKRQPDRRLIVDQEDADAASAARLIRVRQHGGQV